MLGAANQRASAEMLDAPRLLSIRQVVQTTSLCRATIYNYVAAGTFPKPVQVGPGRVAWVQHEVEAWINAAMEAR